MLSSSLLSLGCGVAAPHVPAFDTHQRALDQRSGSLAILGDTQRTSFLERYLLGREDNTAEQPTLTADLIAQQPAALVLVGDLVFDGGSNADWEWFDGLFAGLPRATPVLPIWGNHEYWWSSSERATAAQLAARFRGLPSRRYYSRRLGRLGLILLDSNLRWASRHRPQGARPGALQRRFEARWQAQLRFFAEQLDHFEADPSVDHVLVFTHHPVYSLGPWGHPEPRLHGDLIPAFLSHPKARAWFSGHAHGYERFGLRDGERGARGDKAFVVTAGGGGPRPEQLELRASPLPPAYRGPRPLNYVLASQRDGGLELVVRGLVDGVHASELERLTLRSSASPGN
ncbi:MAG: metallophosphoesterase [Polyangiaceae bacterium]